jgi:hypothetical protein
VDAHQLDHGPHLRLRPAEAQRATLNAESLGENAQIEHQRRVGERQLAEIDDHVALCLDRPREGPSSRTLRRPVLVSLTAQDRGDVIELDDSRNLQNAAATSKSETTVFRSDSPHAPTLQSPNIGVCPPLMT